MRNATATRSTAREYWEQCRRARPDVAMAEFRERRFGGTPAECARMLELMRAGAVTGTFSLLAELQAASDPLPRRGDCCVVTDADGRPGCVIRVVAVQSIPFHQVTEQQTRHGVPEERELSEWRRRYQRPWQEWLERAGRSVDDEMIAFFQQFEVLYAA